MAYILFVNPAILGFVGDPDLQPLGLPFAQVLTVTALVAGVMTILMGVVANYPFALAAGLGLNAFVAFTLVAANGLSFPQAMGVIVVEGVVITVLVLTGVREAVLNAIPMDLKRAIGIGIGAVHRADRARERGRGDEHEGRRRSRLAAELTTWPIGIFVVGLALERRAGGTQGQGGAADRDPGLDGAGDHRERGEGPVDLGQRASRRSRTSVVDTPDFGLVGAFSFDFFSVLGTATALAVVLSVMLSDFFDTMGTVIGLGGEMKMLDGEREAPRHQAGPVGRLARGRGRRRRLGVVEHHLHRERVGDLRGRADRARRRRGRACCSCSRCSSRRSRA